MSSAMEIARPIVSCVRCSPAPGGIFSAYPTLTPMTSTTLIEKTAPSKSTSTPVVLSFTPNLMSEETLREIFVARQPLVDRLVRDIRDATTSRARRHALLVGPRGMGKTHLVSMV